MGLPTDMDAITVTCIVCGWTTEEKTRDWSLEREAEIAKNLEDLKEWQRTNRPH
jgi:hypothetical protein